MTSSTKLNVKIYADGADKKSMLEMLLNPLVQGFTTNPSLMRKAGVQDYKAYALDILSAIKNKSISFEVFADDFAEMKAQALEIAGWGKSVYVKIPIMNSKGESCLPLIQELAAAGVQQNVTALMTVEQVESVTQALSQGPSAYISVFAGRIADTGRDPLPTMSRAVQIMKPYQQLELIWASPRELLNVFQAEEIGCHIITATNDIIHKMQIVGKDLLAFSLETVQMFRQDALAAGFDLAVEPLKHSA